MSISKFFFACRTGDIFSRFSDGRGQARSGRGVRDTRDKEKNMRFNFFPADFPVARVSRSTPASCRLKNSGQQASFFFL